MVFVSNAQMHSLKAKIGLLDVKLTNSFSNVRDDIDNLYSWVEFLKNLVDSQSENYIGINKRLGHVEWQMGHFEQIYGNLDRLNAAAGRLASMQSKIDAISGGYDASAMAELQSRLDGLSEGYSSLIGSMDAIKVRLKGVESSERTVTVQTQPSQDMQPPAHDNTVQNRNKPRLQEKVMRSVSRSSKEFLKNTILSMIRREGEISALALRESIVENQGIASKSTFYRLLEELDSDGSIEMVRVGKEKHYFHVETRKV